jgi:hypothetical protein
VPTTVYSPPETITLALENVTSVSESLSSAAAIDTSQVSLNSEFAPVSAPVPTDPTTFTHTIVVPVVEATKAINSSSGVYYVSIGQNSTNWSYTPTQSTVVGTTTVIVSPIPIAPQSSPNLTTTISTTTHITRTTTRSGTAYSLVTGGAYNGSSPYYPWTNGTGSSTLHGASGSGISTSYGKTVTVHNTTMTQYTTVVVATTSITIYPITISIANATQTTNSASTGTVSSLGFSGTNATFESILSKRQVCTLVYATISGNLASWCNNWDGHSVFHHSTYISTCKQDSLRLRNIDQLVLRF